MVKEINFDMDGTIADLYGYENWLDDLINERTKPYRIAKPLVNMRELGKELNRLQSIGYKINIISWTSKGGSKEYNARVARTKIEWLNHHISSVTFDEINIVNYGTPKSHLGNGILFDDEENNRNEWKGIAYNVNNIIEVLKSLE